jgi:hypothetical protein
MTTRKPEKPRKLDRAKVKVISAILEELHSALGHSVITLLQTEEALKKDAVTLRVNALQFRDDIRALQRMQRSLFAELREVGVK